VEKEEEEGGVGQTAGGRAMCPGWGWRWAGLLKGTIMMLAFQTMIRHPGPQVHNICVAMSLSVYIYIYIFIYIYKYIYI